MAGVKGRSGGAREGAGRKPKPPASAPEEMTPLEFLEAVMHGLIDPTQAQLRAAVAAAQYVHPKVGEGGKKEAKEKAATEAGQGRFAPKQAPRLVVNNGR
jgi:phage terminase small subunit